MTKGGYREAIAGFTVVEVLIVLAVSGLLAISAMVLINGRQAKAEFTTGINGFQQQLQQIVNEVASGYFPNLTGFSCDILPAQSQRVAFSDAAGGGAQGSNKNCIFLGKGIQFGLDSSSAQIATYPFVGAEFINDPVLGTIPVETIADARARLAWPDWNPPATRTISRPGAGDPAADQGGATYPAAYDALRNLTVTAGLEYGLHIAASNSRCTGAFEPSLPVYDQPYRVHYSSPYGSGSTPPVCYQTDSPGLTGDTCTSNCLVETGMAAVLYGNADGTLNTVNASGSLQSGAQQLALYAIGPTPNDGSTSSSAFENIASVAGSVGNLPSYAGNSDISQLHHVDAVYICVADDGTNQSGLFTIGGDGTLSVKLDVKSNPTCA